MPFAIALGFVVALAAPLVHYRFKRTSGWLLALIPGGLFVYFASHVARIAQGDIFSVSYPWVTSLNVDLSFIMDGLSLMMAMIITGIGTLVIIYAGGYLHGDAYLGRFYTFLLIFMAAMIGLVLSDNLLILFVFWELTSISSYLLIGFKHQYGDSRQSALTALLVTGSGGLAMMAGFILLGLVGESWDISQLATNAESIQSHSLYLPILVLIGLGAFTKSAQFPFHFWLPGAMAAPTPVSAYLHSATMVKAGVFLLARLSPVLAGTDEWRLIVTGVGAVTMLVGAYLSIKQTDLKRILAYSTVSSLGIMVMLLGWGTKVAVESAILFILVHSLYKGALFMVAGTIDHETGTRDIRKLGGLLRAMPFVAFGAALAALSMSGIPLSLGFIGKELVYEATLAYTSDAALRPQTGEILLTLASVLGNVAAIVVACLVAILPFIGQPRETPHKPHGTPLSLWIGPVALGIIGLGLGILPGLIGDNLISQAASVTYGEPVELHLALWHGITPMLILSVITVVSGVVIFWRRSIVNAFLEPIDPGLRWGPELLFSQFIDRLPYLAASITRIFQNGYLRYYVMTIIGTTIAIVVYTMVTRLDLPPLNFEIDIRLYELAIGVTITLGVLMVLLSRHLLFTVAALGVIGYGSAMIFILFGAPDLAMTQFAIETLSVVLFVLVLYRLPQLAHLSTPRSRIRDGVIALMAGSVVTTLILVITSSPLNSKLTEFFSTASYEEAHGRNIVNVILVDFRGFDTMGEITVLAIAAIGVFALLKLRVNPTPSENQLSDEESSERP